MTDHQTTPQGVTLTPGETKFLATFLSGLSVTGKPDEVRELLDIIDKLRAGLPEAEHDHDEKAA